MEMMVMMVMEPLHQVGMGSQTMIDQWVKQTAVTLHHNDQDIRHAGEDDAGEDFDIRQC